MLDTFVNNEVDQDSLFSVNLSLEIVALAVFENSLSKAVKIVQDNYNKLDTQLCGAELNRLEYEVDKLVENNRDCLGELVALITRGEHSVDIKWLSKWFQT